MSKKKKRGGDVIDLKERKKERAPRPPRFTRERLIKMGVSALAGTLLFLSCADFNIWPLTWFAVAPLLAVALHPSTRKPAFYGFITGLFANGGGFYWIVPFLERFGHLPRIASIPIFLLLVSYQAITFAVFAWAVRRLDDRFGIGVTFLAPVVYVACEMVVPYVFPWYLAITQAWVRPAIQIADLTGPLGVSFLLVLCNGAIYDAWASWRAKKPLPLPRLAVAVGLLAASLGYGLVRIDQVTRARAAAPKLRIGVVQANIGIHEKWHPQLAQSQLYVHQTLARELEAKGAELVVWPESSYPFYFARDQSQDWPESDARRAKRGFKTPLLFGTLTADTRSPYPFNSAMLLDKDGDVRGLFDKNILMVFGEYIPYYEQLKFIKQWIPETSNWGRGTDVSVFPLSTDKGVVRLGPMICYEDIFPSFARRLIKRDPNILVNITNDAWFGRTSEPYEHLALAVYRSVESRLDLVRAVNTGVSAYVDATGRVFDKSPSVDPDETPDAKPVGLINDVAVMQPFKVYATLGEWFGGLCLLAAVVLGLMARARGGAPVRWRLVGAGAGALAITTIVLAAVFCGPGHLRVVLRLLAHRPLGVDADVAFTVGVHLLPAVTIGCLVAGAVVSRLARTPKGERGPRLEMTMSVLAILVAPAVLFGTLEGEQAGLVISAMLATGLAFFAGRIYRRIFSRPGVAAYDRDMRASWSALAIVLAGGCGPTPPPPVGGEPAQEVLYLVHNQIWRIGADGSGAARLTTVGDDAYRTGFPRRLADGQLALLADDTGAIYPYLVDDGRSRTVGATNVTIHDAVCAATVGGAAALVYTVTPFAGGHGSLMRADPAASDVQAVAVESAGELSEPAPWDDGAVLAVRSAHGQVTLEILDVAGSRTREVLATVDAPYSAHAPARLPDGRVVFVRTDPRDSTDTAIGELFVLERGGAARTTGITGVLALVVVGDEVVYEVGGADGVTDLVRTNLVDPPVNLTRTPTVAEHLGWSD